MFQLGYIKDSLALFSFTFVICKIYNLNHKNLENIKNEFIIYFIIAFITDFSFTLYPQFHYTNVGYNYFTYYFILMITLLIINFIYFNKQLFLAYLR